MRVDKQEENYTDIRVSVVIPTYHGTDTLERAIGSVLDQDMDSIEIIVVDDNDNGTEYRRETERIVSSFRNKMINYLPSLEHKNASAARNIGAMAANGDYIAFLDDDDVYLPNHISSCFAILEQQEKYAAVTTGGYHVENNILKYYSTYYREDGEYLKNMFRFLGVLGTGSNIFIRKNAYESLYGFDESFTKRQDLEFMVRVMEKYDVFHIPELQWIKFDNRRYDRKLSYFETEEMDRKFYSKYYDIMSRMFSNEEIQGIYKIKYEWLLRVAIASSTIETEAARIELKKYRDLNMKERVLCIFNRQYRWVRGLFLVEFIKQICNGLPVSKLTPEHEIILGKYNVKQITVAELVGITYKSMKNHS